ncbi:MAG: hypothetical protein JNN08_11160 [Bryobacterales bacterium]|nr:hypothetical protein [Bryobacterales bacterium]
MALLIDGPASTIEDLQAVDSSILETARNENISVTAKLDVARQAIELELSVFLLRTGNLGFGGDRDLRRVVVTPGLRRWHVLRTLAEVYGDAYSSQLNDRYLGKWKSFKEMARETAELLMELGVGLVDNPVIKASMPTVSAAPGAGAGGVYAVRVAWRNSMGQSGAASDAVVVEMAPGEVPSVEVGAMPGECTGWDVYLGDSVNQTMRQNESPLAPGSSWTLPVDGTVPGPSAPSGQSPEYFVRKRRVF